MEELFSGTVDLAEHENGYLLRNLNETEFNKIRGFDEVDDDKTKFEDGKMTEITLEKRLEDLATQIEKILTNYDELRTGIDNLNTKYDAFLERYELHERNFEELKRNVDKRLNALEIGRSSYSRKFEQLENRKEGDDIEEEIEDRANKITIFDFVNGILDDVSNVDNTTTAPVINEVFGISATTIEKYISLGTIKRGPKGKIVKSGIDKDKEKMEQEESIVGDADISSWKLEISGVLRAVLEEYSNFRRSIVMYPYLKISEKDLLRRGLTRGILDEFEKGDDGKYSVLEVDSVLARHQTEIKDLLTSKLPKLERGFKNHLSVINNEEIKFKKYESLTSLINSVGPDLAMDEKEAFTFVKDYLGKERLFASASPDIKQRFWRVRPVCSGLNHKKAKTTSLIEARIRRNNDLLYRLRLRYEVSTHNQIVDLSDIEEKLKMTAREINFVKTVYSAQRRRGRYDNDDLKAVSAKGLYDFLDKYNEALKNAKEQLRIKSLGRS